MSYEPNPTTQTTGIISTNEVDIRSLFKTIWHARYFILGLVMLAALSFAGLISFLTVGIASQQTYQQAVRFVFPEVESGHYPNGSKFSPNDLAAPIIMQSVYKKNKLKSHGIKMNEFTSGLSIVSYAPTLSEAIIRYRIRLASKKLSFVERQEIEKEMANELSNLSNQNAMIRLTFNKRFGIPDELGTKLVNDIAVTWADFSINNRGVLNLPESIERKELIDQSLLDSLDYPIAADLLSQSVRDLRARVFELQKIDGSNSIVDDKSGHTVKSLLRSLSLYSDYELNNLVGSIIEQRIMIFPVRTLGALKRRLDVVALERETYELKANVIAKGLREYKSAGPRSDSVNGATNDTTQIPATTAVPQLNEGFLDRIIELSGQRANQEFRETLIQKQINLRQQAIEIGLKQKLLKRTINQIVENTSTPSLAANNDASITKNKLQNKIPIYAGKLNNYWMIAGRLFDQLSEKRLSYSNQLYVNLFTPDPIIKFHPIVNGTTAIIFFSLLFGVAVLGVLLALMLRIFRSG